MLVGYLVLKLSIILIIALIFGAFMGCLVGTSHFIRDDWRHLSLIGLISTNYLTEFRVLLKLWELMFWNHDYR